ncbi:hypothetical protein [Ottowia oryzae]|uniref:Uncharacterized protein n=1 Tax=Ottowia oryzae TaxID=2109914 RepID=A0A2S0MB62_9BURK|nr:hypothetical protein [Ottowia oryzae]AVO33031.1 hypothetical protein C6570_01245 [Ottowia oryzae]
MASLHPNRGLRAAGPVLPAPDINDCGRRTPRTLQQAFPESEGYRFAFHGPYGLTLSERLAARFWRLLGAQS